MYVCMYVSCLTPPSGEKPCDINVIYTPLKSIHLMSVMFNRLSSIEFRALKLEFRALTE